MIRRAAGIVALGAFVGLGALDLNGRVGSSVAQSAPSGDLIQFKRRAEVSRADLDYTSPPTRSEEGMPIGTGRMGTLIWTSPSAIRMQINRVDVHAMDSTTFSFGRADTDYGYGCG